MTDKMENVVCPCCGAVVPKQKFCSECGQLLDGSNGVVIRDDTKPFLEPFKTKQEKQQKALSDEGLTLLVNTCKKTIATVGGDGYSEIVLYVDPKTEEYFIHTYSKYVYMEQEAHASYVTTKEFADKVFSYIEENNLVALKDNKGVPMCGGDYILKFKYKGEIIRLDSGKMMSDLTPYNDVSNMLYAEANEENRRYQDS